MKHNRLKKLSFLFSLLSVFVMLIPFTAFAQHTDDPYYVPEFPNDNNQYFALFTDDNINYTLVTSNASGWYYETGHFELDKESNEYHFNIKNDSDWVLVKKQAAWHYYTWDSKYSIDSNHTTNSENRSYPIFWHLKHIYKVILKAVSDLFNVINSDPLLQLVIYIPIVLMVASVVIMIIHKVVYFHKKKNTNTSYRIKR